MPISSSTPFIPYMPIGDHGVIGDRRTAALIARDGTLNWLCVPDYDSKALFASLLDAGRGGFWRMGPQRLYAGEQSYWDHTAVLITRWQNIILTDTMVWEGLTAGVRSPTTIIRHLKISGNARDATFAFDPTSEFGPLAAKAVTRHNLFFSLKNSPLQLWVNQPLRQNGGAWVMDRPLSSGEDLWAVLSTHPETEWTVKRAQTLAQETRSHWKTWVKALNYSGLRSAEVKRSAVVLHMMGYSPTGALVAAPTTSLPEQIGGQGNWDYRYAWIRDASLSLAGLIELGDFKSAVSFMDWIVTLGSSTTSPLQVVYGLRGETKIPQRERRGVAGYRHSPPVRSGNRAYKMLQLDSLGYLADCMLTFLKREGPWKESYWALLCRLADFTLRHWSKLGHGIWELPAKRHYVSSRVMSWVVLDRAVQIAARLGRSSVAGAWQTEKDKIHREVLKKAWSPSLGAFRQYYEGESLDASALLMPIVGFLPAKDPRVLKTIKQIETHLTINGYVYRFDPATTPGVSGAPLRAIRRRFFFFARSG